jgi:hypothetical protein
VILLILLEENMGKYEHLTDVEVRKYQSMLVLPNIDFPHYDPLKKNEIVVLNYEDINPMKGEKFIKSGYLKSEDAKELLISNYGRVIYDNELIKPFVVDTFLHCLKVYFKNMNEEFYVHRIVKETFDPIEDMSSLQVHHISNNALDNSLDNLLWVTKEDHDRIHDRNLKFTQEIMRIGKIIYGKNMSKLRFIFIENPEKEFTGKELIDKFSNFFEDVIFEGVIKDNIYSLVKKNIIHDITVKNNTIFNNKVFKLNVSWESCDREQEDIIPSYGTNKETFEKVIKPILEKL